MKQWKRIGNYAQGTIYARGDERKLVIPNCPVIYYELDTQKVWWDTNNVRNKLAGVSR